MYLYDQYLSTTKYSFLRARNRDDFCSQRIQANSDMDRRSASRQRTNLRRYALQPIRTPRCSRNPLCCVCSPNWSARIRPAQTLSSITRTPQESRPTWNRCRRITADPPCPLRDVVFCLSIPQRTQRACRTSCITCYRPPASRAKKTTITPLARQRWFDLFCADSDVYKIPCLCLFSLAEYTKVEYTKCLSGALF